MRFSETEIPGVVLVQSDPHGDERGTFVRIWDSAKFAEHGLADRPLQWSLSSNPRAGTLRGLHYQERPHTEAKLVRCVRGAMYDVALDLRPDSPTFRRWFALELRAGDARAVYIPEGLAHGFQTLEDDTDVLYAISAVYEASASRGVRWDDPAFGIDWPEVGSRVISERDQSWPDFVG